MWSGVVPQHPPAIFKSPSSAKVKSELAVSSGFSSYPVGAKGLGKPAMRLSGLENFTLKGESKSLIMVGERTNVTGSPSENSGIEIERGTSTNKTFIWDETNDRWTLGSETLVAGTLIGNVTGNVTGTVSDISNHNTGDLTEGSNLYYTTAVV